MENNSIDEKIKNIKTEETKADVKKSIVEKSANSVYFDAHQSELKTGGIIHDTYISRMEKEEDFKL